LVNDDVLMTPGSVKYWEHIRRC